MMRSLGNSRLGKNLLPRTAAFNITPLTPYSIREKLPLGYDFALGAPIFANGAAGAAFSAIISEGIQAANRPSKPDFDSMTKGERVAWIQKNSDALGIDMSNVKNINLDDMNTSVVRVLPDGGLVSCNSCDGFGIGGDFNPNTGEMRLFAGAFDSVKNLQIPTLVGSDGISVLDSVSRNYSGMENLIHTMGHEGAHSRGIDLSGAYHPNAERAGMRAADNFRGMY